MPQISMSANKAHRDGSAFTSVSYGRDCTLATATAEARTVEEAVAALARFSETVSQQHHAAPEHSGAYVSASWPHGIRKPSGWDAAYKAHRLNHYIALPEKLAA